MEQVYKIVLHPNVQRLCVTQGIAQPAPYKLSAEDKDEHGVCSWTCSCDGLSLSFANPP